MEVFGKISARIFITVGAMVTTLTILLCYTLAISLHHRPVWLPTISECGDLPPEKYFFRWGILVGGLVLVVTAVTLYTAQRTSTVSLALGILAGLCLSGVAVVGDNENNTVHTIFAVVFFVCEDIKDILFIVEGYQQMSCTSLTVMISSTAVAIISTLIKIFQPPCVLRTISDFPLLAIVEWTNTAAIIIAQVCIAGTLSNIFIAEIDRKKSSNQVTEKVDQEI